MTSRYYIHHFSVAHLTGGKFVFNFFFFKGILFSDYCAAVSTFSPFFFSVWQIFCSYNSDTSYFWTAAKVTDSLCSLSLSPFYPNVSPTYSMFSFSLQSVSHCVPIHNNLIVRYFVESILRLEHISYQHFIDKISEMIVSSEITFYFCCQNASGKLYHCVHRGTWDWGSKFLMKISGWQFSLFATSLTFSNERCGPDNLAFSNCVSKQ